jgi:hypothetical protein
MSSLGTCPGSYGMLWKLAHRNCSYGSIPPSVSQNHPMFENFRPLHLITLLPDYLFPAIVVPLRSAERLAEAAPVPRSTPQYPAVPRSTPQGHAGARRGTKGYQAATCTRSLGIGCFGAKRRQITSFPTINQKSTCPWFLTGKIKNDSYLLSFLKNEYHPRVKGHLTWLV